MFDHQNSTKCRLARVGNLFTFRKPLGDLLKFWTNLKYILNNLNFYATAILEMPDFFLLEVPSCFSLPPYNFYFRNQRILVLFVYSGRLCLNYISKC